MLRGPVADCGAEWSDEDLDTRCNAPTEGEAWMVFDGSLVLATAGRAAIDDEAPVKAPVGWPLRLPACASLFAWEAGLEEAVHNLLRLYAACNTPLASTAAAAVPQRAACDMMFRG